MNTKILFNEDWEFLKTPLGTTLEDMGEKQSEFSPVEIPHDWLIFNSQDLYEDSTGWYRKGLFVEDHQSNPEHIWLQFDGVYMDSTLYVNGQKAGEWKYGYSAFEIELTKYLKSGDNELLLQVCHQSPNSRWYTGAGIYRNVWLRTATETYIKTNGVYISTQKEEHGWTVEIETQLCLKEEVVIRQTLLEKRTQKVILQESKAISNLEEERNVAQILKVGQVKLWDLEDPYLYLLRTEIMVGNALLDQEENTVGFRTVEFRPDGGLFLNGKHVKINGVCEHHDLGCLGAAYNQEAMRRKLEILKNMGVNGIRTAHNMPAKEFMDLTDEMGVLVNSEAFDMWERSKTPYDYGRFFKEWYQRDVASWIQRDRNHPSIIMWSIGNEIYDTHVDERGKEITLQLMKEVKKHDPKGNGAITIGSNYMTWENARKCADVLKLTGYNYTEKLYEEHHKKYPDWIIYGSETSSTVQSRGIYHFPLEKSLLSDVDLQCSALGNSTTSWGAKSSESCIIAERDCDFSIGQFLWTGFDYIGEPTPYHTKNSYLGQVDTAGFPKDSYFIYQSAWTDYKKHPMIHIFPYWDFNEGQTVDVRVCSNAPKIALWQNGVKVGEKFIDHKQGSKLTGDFSLTYTKGYLEAFAYDEEGKIIARQRRNSFLEGKQIELLPNKWSMKADGRDLIFVEIKILDLDGHVVENANNRVKVMVEGPGRLVGLDNGDSTDYESYKGISRRLFQGKLLAVIGSKYETGEIRVHVSGWGVKDKTIIIHGEGIMDMDSKRYLEVNKETVQLYPPNGIDKPIRKIELSCAKTRLNTEISQVTVTAELFPPDAREENLIWGIVDDGGIGSNLAEIQGEGKEVVVKARGDGRFRLRCMVENGTGHVDIISQLDFTVEGLGKTYLNPYGFIAGGLYHYSNGGAGNGNEHGVATARDEETVIAYRDLEFGKYGSNRITMPIFALTDELYIIEIWEGIPNETGSEQIDQVMYQKPSKWNVYQEETYVLSRKLRGITTIGFVLRQKIHLKGFSFAKIHRGLEKLMASECDNVYGDCFTIVEDRIENIGNNVTLEFEQMEFKEKGVNKIIICGKSHIEKNGIHMQFIRGEEKLIEMIEFPYSHQEIVKEFSIPDITGEYKVNFVFLPGSQFDFHWFQFS